MLRGGSIETSNLRFFSAGVEQAVPPTARAIGRRRNPTGLCLRCVAVQGPGDWIQYKEPSPWTGGTQTTMQVQDFAAVLARARQGDPEAMARLVEEYEPEVR